jgi:hypothetical protein
MDEDWGTAPRTEAIKVRLRDVLKPRQTTNEYLYDFGDSWAHRLMVTTRRQGAPGVSYPLYVGGEWNCPPEDCGGIPGYYNMLGALADPQHQGEIDIHTRFHERCPNNPAGTLMLQVVPDLGKNPSPRASRRPGLSPSFAKAHTAPAVE